MNSYNYNPYNGYYQPATCLNGQLVNNFEQAAAADVPIGGYGVFPKNDLSEIYIKSWNNSGTVNMLTYKLAEGQPNTPDNGLSQINDKLDSLIEKIDTLL